MAIASTSAVARPLMRSTRNRLIQTSPPSGDSRQFQAAVKRPERRQ